MQLSFVSAHVFFFLFKFCIVEKMSIFGDFWRVALFNLICTVSHHFVYCRSCLLFMS